MIQFETDVEIGTILQLDNYILTVIDIENDEVHFRVEQIADESNTDESNPERDDGDFTLPPK